MLGKTLALRHRGDGAWIHPSIGNMLGDLESCPGLQAE